MCPNCLYTTDSESELQQHIDGKHQHRVPKVSTVGLGEYSDADLLAELNERMSKTDRFEVIDEGGRSYVKGSIYGSPISLTLSLQDRSKTLKVFIKSKTEIDDMTEPSKELLSDCCSSPMQGEETNRIMHNDDIIEGRCARCKEMAVFTEG